MRRVQSSLLFALVAVFSGTRGEGTGAVKRCPGSPNQCSLHGSCVIDKQGDYVCNCEWGYHGVDCSKKMCPHGFDPDAQDAEEKRLRLFISSSEAIGGSLILTFHLHSVEFDLPLARIRDDECTRIFQRFQNLGEVSCVRTSFEEPSTAEYEITLHSFPVYPVMNNLYQHNGNPPATEFWCEPSSSLSPAAAQVLCKFESITDSHVKVYSPCSNHGLCNERTGLCTCEHGYYGESCRNTQDEEDILVAPSHGPFFKGNVLRVTAMRSRSTEFNLIKADIAGEPVLTIDGNGDTKLQMGSLSLLEGNLELQRGELSVREGGALRLDGADLSVNNGKLLVSHIAASTSATDGVLLHVNFVPHEHAAGLDSIDFLRITHDSTPIFRVSSSGGTVIHEGGLEVWKGGVKVQRGGIQVLSEGIRVLNGGVSIQNHGLNVNSGILQVRDGTSKLRSSSEQAPVLHVEYAGNGEDTGSAILQISQGITKRSFLKAMREDKTLFEVHPDGGQAIHGGGIKVHAGGIDIESGGQRIRSGGLHIESGGLEIESGTFTVRGGFEVGDGGLKVQHSASNGFPLHVASLNPLFEGSLLSLDVSKQATASYAQPFTVLSVHASPDEPILSIDHSGTVETKGDIVTINKGRVVSSGALVSEAQIVFSSTSIVAESKLLIPSTHSYVKVQNDGADRENIAKIDRATAYAGQLLVIQNEDEQPLTGEVNVKPFSAAIYVFDGHDWRALTAASFDTSVISGVTQFEAANDINIGEVRLTAKSVQVGDQPAGFVTMYGKGGELTHDESFVFDASSSTLSVSGLRAQSIKGRIDMSESELHGVEIVGGHISSVNMTSLEMVEVQGEMFVESQAYFGAGITVDGQVMGSGAYVDASDARFKRVISQLDSANALASVRRMQGVEYEYRTENFPTKKFSTNPEIGFIAQEVEKIIPSVVQEDGEGYKYVAYARIVPLVVEATKELSKQQEECTLEVQRLRHEIDVLRETVQQLHSLLVRKDNEDQERL